MSIYSKTLSFSVHVWLKCSFTSAHICDLSIHNGLTMNPHICYNNKNANINKLKAAIRCSLLPLFRFRIRSFKSETVSLVHIATWSARAQQGLGRRVGEWCAGGVWRRVACARAQCKPTLRALSRQRRGAGFFTDYRCVAGHGRSRGMGGRNKPRPAISFAYALRRARLRATPRAWPREPSLRRSSARFQLQMSRDVLTVRDSMRW